MNVFSKIESIIQMALNIVLSALQSQWVSGITTVAQVSITLYIVVFGYMVFAGKIQTPLPDLLWNLAKFGIILAFISNTGGYLTMTNEAVDGLKGFFAGGVSSFSLLDEKIGGVAKLASEIWKDASGIKDSVIAVFRVIGLLPLLLGIVTAGAMLVFTEITLKILLATAPIFIFCLMWGFLRDSFNNWLSAILGNCLIILFTNTTMQFGFLIAKEAVTDKGSSEGFIVPLVLLVIAGLLTIMAVKWGREMALALARVSVDAGIGGSQKSTESTAIREYKRLQSKKSGK